MQRATALLLVFFLVAGLACTDKAAPSAAEDQPEPEFVITVPAGSRSAEIMDLVRSADFLTGELESEQLREGWLAPGDYAVALGTARSEIIAMMVARQEGRLGAVWDYRTPNLPLTTATELLVLASLVECEAPGPDFLGPVASVFINRLRRGMRLQSDAALIYGITRGKVPLDRGLQQRDLKQDTPWNTYLHQGLPQTPICAPSIAAIGASSRPPETDYLYFSPNAEGGLVFAKTIVEHSANITKLREASARK